VALCLCSLLPYPHITGLESGSHQEPALYLPYPDERHSRACLSRIQPVPRIRASNHEIEQTTAKARECYRAREEP